MKPHTYPFSAIVGQDAMKLCLILAAIDWRLSVLLRGEKGGGKSTAARALTHILPGEAPFVNVPIGVTDDRLLGSLDLKAALSANHQFRHGLIDEAHGGVLYLDEVNLLAGHLADALLDVSSTGLYVLERDGFSHSRVCQFALLGSMNLEEGQLRPQLLDRFALALDVTPPTESDARAEILLRRLRYDHDPGALHAEFAASDEALRLRIASARSRLSSTQVPADLLRRVAACITGAGVLSLRADLALIRASRALAAFEENTETTGHHIEAVLPFVLLHRARTAPLSNPPAPPAPEPPRDRSSLPPDSQATGSPAANSQPAPPQAPAPAQLPERMFAPVSVQAPGLQAKLPSASQRGRTHNESNGNARSAPHETHFAGLDVVRSLTEAARQTGQALLREDILIPRGVRFSGAARYLFVVDASGSQASRSRMRAVKGAAIAFLESAASTQDEVAVVAFRGTSARLLLPPCRSVEEARRQLELLPTGGRTPLAHGLATARDLCTPSTILILLTDGQANVPLNTGDAWRDALDEAARITCPALVVDNATGERRQAKVDALCHTLRATRLPLEHFQSTALVAVSRPDTGS